MLSHIKKKIGIEYNVVEYNDIDHKSTKRIKYKGIEDLKDIKDIDELNLVISSASYKITWKLSDKLRIIYFKKGKKHRVNKPAIQYSNYFPICTDYIIYNKQRKITISGSNKGSNKGSNSRSIHWFINGKYDRYYGPAYIKINYLDYKITICYYKRNLLHRFDRPALINIFKDAVGYGYNEINNIDKVLPIIYDRNEEEIKNMGFWIYNIWVRSTEDSIDYINYKKLIRN